VLADLAGAEGVFLVTPRKENVDSGALGEIIKGCNCRREFGCDGVPHDHDPEMAAEFGLSLMAKHQVIEPLGFLDSCSWRPMPGWR